MRNKTLTLGEKTGLGTVMLVAVLAAMAWFALHTVRSSKEAFDVMADQTARMVELAGIMNTAESNMAAGQLGVVLFTYGKNSERQISTALYQMEQVTRRSAANTEQSAAASEEIASQAQSLYSIVERLRLLVSGNQEATRFGDPRQAGYASFTGRKTAMISASTSVHARAAFPLDDEGGF